MANSIAEFGIKEPRLSAALGNMLGEIEDAFTYALEKARASGELPEGRDPRTLARLLTTLGQGELMYRQGEQRHYLAVFQGYMEVNDDKVTMLVDFAEPAHEIDRARAESARDRAEERLRHTTADDIDFDRARAALERAMIRLQVTSK